MKEFFKDFTYLKRGEGREKDRERNINVNISQLPLTCTPSTVPGPHPRHVPRLGLELATFHFVG